MKNKKFILVLGIILLISGGIIFWQMKNRNQGNVVEQPINNVLSQEAATSLVNDTIRNVINIYENQEKTFKVKGVQNNQNETTEENKDEKTEVKESEFDDYYIVTNYKEIVDNLFTENGIKELENTIFDKKKFVVKQDDNIYVLKKIPDDNRYKNSNVAIEKLDIKENEITCNVTFSTYSLQEDETLSYYIIVKNLKLIKNENNWLVDTFSYKND